MSVAMWYTGVLMAEQKLAIKANELRAFELRWEGLPADEVVKALNKEFPKTRITVSSYHHWFDKSGRLFEAYAEFVETRQNEIRQMVNSRLHRMANKALFVLEDQITPRKDKKGKVKPFGMIGFFAAKETLERTVGKADAESGRVVVVQLVDPVKKEDVPLGYNPDGTPRTTVNDAVALVQERLGTEKLRQQMGLTPNGQPSPVSVDPEAPSKAPDNV